MNPALPPYPLGFDANAQCDFHVGALGHSVEDCKMLKSKVQNLLDSKIFSFTPAGLRINHNPLPGHVGPSINIMEEVAENGREVIIISFLIRRTTSNSGKG